MTAKELRQNRAKLVADMRKLVDTADTEKRAMTGEEQGQWDKLNADVDTLKADIDKRERMESLDKEMAAPAGNAAPPHEERAMQVAGGGAADPAKAATELRTRAFRKYMVGGAMAMTPEERSAIETRAFGDSSITGFGVSDGFKMQIFEQMKDYSSVEKAPISYKKTTTGNQYPVLLIDDTNNTGELLAENTQTSIADFSGKQVTLGAYLFSSKAILVSMQALQDVDGLEQEVTRAAGIRIGRARGAYFTTGTGVNQPLGIVTAAVSEGLTVTAATGQTTNFNTGDDIITLAGMIDPAYRDLADGDDNPLCGYMFHDKTLTSLKKLKDSYGRYLWTPGLAEREDPDLLNGYPYYVNNFMPQMAASATSMVFGFWPAFMVRDVDEVIVMRLTERYADYFQVGFINGVRSDSRIVQTNAFAVYQNSAT